MRLIVAVDDAFGIGKNGQIPWRLKGDLTYFKEQTLGQAVIMGRKTLESLPNGKPLKDRVNIVLTHDTDFTPDGVIVKHSVEDVLSMEEAEDAFVIGGESVYKAFLPYCTSALVTKVRGNFGADTHMVNLDALENWTLTQSGEPIEENGLTYRFTVYENTKPSKRLRETIENIDCVCLMCDNDEFDADVKIALLKSCGILAFKKYGGFSSVAKTYCGSSNLGVYIFVSTAQYAEAKAVLEAPFDTSELEEE